MAVTWAIQSREGLFWTSAQGQRTFVFGSASDSVPRTSARDVQSSRVPKNQEDENWLAKLRNLGMPPNDEWKIVALREYIWRMAQSKPRLLSDHAHSPPITATSLKIKQRTVFFDESEIFFNLPPTLTPEGNPGRPMTIADALLDASRTIDQPLRKTASKLHLERLASDIRRQQRGVESGGSISGSGSTTPITAVQADTNIPSASATKPLQVPRVKVTGTSESPTSPSSVESGTGLVLRHKTSKNSLLNRGMGPSKAMAETSTVPATAFGKVEAPSTARTTQSGVIDTVPDQPAYKFRAAHSYMDRDPYILNLLDSVYLQSYPSDIVEFGPTIVPIHRRQPIKKSNGRVSAGTWKPEGTFVASFSEHTEPINRVVVAPDHNFFLTASDDGTVKIWDSTRLEKNVAFRARQSYKHASNAKIKSLCFIENTRCFASGATDGSIHVVKVEYSASAARYGKLKVMREYQLPGQGEYAVWMEHFKADNNCSILLIATNTSNVHALDLRTLKVQYTLKNPTHHGTPTCFCLDRKNNWMVLGTSHGILDMWDLRYQLRLKAWGLPSGTPIHRVQVHPSKGRSKWVIVAGGTGVSDLSVWDCEKTQCREVYRAGPAPVKGYDPWLIDDSTPESVLAKFAREQPEPAVDRGVRAFFAAQDMAEEDARVLPGFILSAGADRKIRFWNTVRVEGSLVVSGLDVDELRPSYAASHPTTVMTVNVERPAGEEAESAVAPASGIRGFLGSVSGAPKRKTQSAGGRNSRSTVISLQQQQLLRNHLDSVTDVAFLEVPYGMVVSVDRGGMVFVYQ